MNSVVYERNLNMTCELREAKLRSSIRKSFFCKHRMLSWIIQNFFFFSKIFSEISIKKLLLKTWYNPWEMFYSVSLDASNRHTLIRNFVVKICFLAHKNMRKTLQCFTREKFSLHICFWSWDTFVCWGNIWKLDHCSSFRFCVLNFFLFHRALLLWLVQHGRIFYLSETM